MHPDVEETQIFEALWLFHISNVGRWSRYQRLGNNLGLSRILAAGLVFLGLRCYSHSDPFRTLIRARFIGLAFSSFNCGNSSYQPWNMVEIPLLSTSVAWYEAFASERHEWIKSKRSGPKTLLDHIELNRILVEEEYRVSGPKWLEDNAIALPASVVG